MTWRHAAPSDGTGAALACASEGTDPFLPSGLVADWLAPGELNSQDLINAGIFESPAFRVGLPMATPDPAAEFVDAARDLASG